MSKTKEYLENLSGQLRELGHEDAASAASSLIFDPMTLGFATKNLNLDAFSESGDESEIDTDHVQQVLNKAGLYGFGGECAEAAIAINDVLFNEEGKLVAAVNKWLWENEGRAVGHAAVEWNGEYWDAEGKKDWGEIESWGMVDELDSDYDLGDDPEKNAYLTDKIYLSKEKAIKMFGDCNLRDMIKKLEMADKEIQDEKESK